MELKPNEQVIELVFPTKGYQTAIPRTQELLTTSPLIANVRGKDVIDRRVGGQRAGLKKAFVTQISDGKPVVKMVLIITTYIPPV